jgi:two-component system, OmpR family, response regulator ChvI
MGTDLRANNYNQRPTQNEKKRILAVDDEPDVTLTLKLILEGSGLFDVDTYNDPEQALSSFKPGSYALLLIDFKMPKMNGYELYDKIKNIDDKVKVCFISAAYMNPENAREVFPFLKKIECIIQKPVEIPDLIGRVKAKLMWET